MAVLIGKLDIRESLSDILIHWSTFSKKSRIYPFSKAGSPSLRVSLCHFSEETFPFQLLEQGQIHELFRLGVFRIG